MYYSSHTPKLLNRLNCESKCENNRRTKSCECSLARNTLGMEGCAKASRWGLHRGTSKSITHTNLHKPNNKLVSAQLEHFQCTNESRTNMDSQDSPWPELGGSHHLPLYNILCVSPQGQHPIVICPKTPKLESRNFQNCDSHNYGSPYLLFQTFDQNEI